MDVTTYTDSLCNLANPEWLSFRKVLGHRCWVSKLELRCRIEWYLLLAVVYSVLIKGIKSQLMI